MVSANALTGPWAFVASDALPADFARIPPTSLAGAVLPAVAGTAQAREAVAENSVPQTATVPRQNGPAFTAKFDGAPQFVPEPGTSLSRAVNASVPIVRSGDAYYALKAGIWFSAAQPAGPWSVATAVPDAIYSIPATSPIHFVTFVRIYGATPNAVFEGYTPGYLGAITAQGGTVVYGTGYNYKPWIGDAWYPAPATYGLAAAPVFNPRVGYTYSFAVGLATAEWSQPYFGGARFHPGYWGNYPCCGSASANVYRAWFKPAQAKAKKTRARACDDGSCDGPAGAAAAIQSRRGKRTRQFGTASAHPAHGHRARLRHVDGRQRRRCERGSCAGDAERADVHLRERVLREPREERRMGPGSANNNTYADANGGVYRKHPRRLAAALAERLERGAFAAACGRGRSRNRARTSIPACRRARTA